MHIRRDDTVEVITGDSRGKRGKVMTIDLKNERVKVEGVNTVVKHMRPSRSNPQGGRLQMESSVHLSNILLVCSSCHKATRTGVRVEADGSKVRVCKKCGAGIGELMPAKKKS